jgi:hypothetical protein
MNCWSWVCDMRYKDRLATYPSINMWNIVCKWTVRNMVIVQNFAISSRFTMIRVCTSVVCTEIIGCSGKENKNAVFHIYNCQRMWILSWVVFDYRTLWPRSALEVVFYGIINLCSINSSKEHRIFDIKVCSIVKGTFCVLPVVLCI